MSALRDRAALAAIGRDLLAQADDAGARRGAALLGSPGPRRSVPRASFADLSAAPPWLRRSRDEQRRVATRAALLAMAPTIAGSIDGEWLGDLARATDDATLDWAIGFAAGVPDGGIAAIAAPEIEAFGFDLMRATLPPMLATYLAWAPGGGGAVGPVALAAFCVAHAAGDAAEKLAA